MLNFSINTLKNEVLFHIKSSTFLFSLLLLVLVFNPQYSSAFFYNNQGNSLLYGNVGSASSLYSNPGGSYGPNTGLMYGGGGINNGFGMMPGYGYGGSSFGSGGLLDVLSAVLGLGSAIYGGGGINNGFGMMPGYGYGGSSFGSGGLLDVLSGVLGLDSGPNQEFGSDYISDYEYGSNNNLDDTLQPNDEMVDFGYDSDYGYNSDSDYGYNSDSDYGYNSDSDYDNNEFQSDFPIEDLRSVDSPTEEQFSFQNDYDFSQTPEGDFSSDLFQ
jgi:hypothetical protein